MRFGPVPVGEATGAILARSLSTANGRIRKGKVLTAGDIAALAAAGHQEITGVRLDPGDMGEDEAAEPIAAALVPDPAAAGLRLTEAATGQVNIRATGPGVLGFDAATIEAANRVDPMITIATLPTFARTRVRGMVATVKIISYGVAEHLVRAAAGRASGAMRHHPDPGRLCHLGPCRCRARGLRRAGGAVTRFGLPVDPGNLLFPVHLPGHLRTRPVIGPPGCARSPALNGADWVLERVVCGLPVTGADMAAMGGGRFLEGKPGQRHAA